MPSSGQQQPTSHLSHLFVAMTDSHKTNRYCKYLSVSVSEESEEPLAPPTQQPCLKTCAHCTHAIMRTIDSSTRCFTDVSPLELPKLQMSPEGFTRMQTSDMLCYVLYRLVSAASFAAGVPRLMILIMNTCPCQWRICE